MDFKSLLGCCIVGATATACGWGSPPPGKAVLALKFAEVPECEQVVDDVCADFVSEFVLEGVDDEIRFRTGPGGEFNEVLEPGTYTLRAPGSDGCPLPGEVELQEDAVHAHSVVWPVRC